MSSQYVVWSSAPTLLRGLSWVDPRYVYEIVDGNDLSQRLAAARTMPKDPEDLVVVIADRRVDDDSVYMTLIVAGDSPDNGRVFIVRPKREGG